MSERKFDSISLSITKICVKSKNAHIWHVAGWDILEQGVIHTLSEFTVEDVSCYLGIVKNSDRSAQLMIYFKSSKSERIYYKIKIMNQVNRKDYDVHPDTAAFSMFANNGYSSARNFIVSEKVLNELLKDNTISINITLESTEKSNGNAVKLTIIDLETPFETLYEDFMTEAFPRPEGLVVTEEAAKN